MENGLLSQKINYEEGNGSNNCNNNHRLHIKVHTQPKTCRISSVNSSFELIRKSTDELF